jgi:hypothetical protein
MQGIHIDKEHKYCTKTHIWYTNSQRAVKDFQKHAADCYVEAMELYHQSLGCDEVIIRFKLQDTCIIGIQAVR